MKWRLQILSVSTDALNSNLQRSVESERSVPFCAQTLLEACKELQGAKMRLMQWLAEGLRNGVDGILCAIIMALPIGNALSVKAFHVRNLYTLHQFDLSATLKNWNSRKCMAINMFVFIQHD